MKAAKLVGKEKHQIIDAPKPVISDEEVLVKVIHCGFCASELEAWASGVYTDNDYLGHEVVGIVEAVGDRVNRFAVGDRVTGYILSGFAEYAKAHYSLITKVPESLDDKEALGEPLGCLMSGAMRTHVPYGDSVAVIGLGYMGLGFMQLMKIQGASKIVAMDVRQDALDNAKRFGADSGILTGDVGDDLKVTTYGVNMDGGFPVVVEASGHPMALDLAGEMTAVHGTMSIVGFHQGDKRKVSIDLWNWKALSIINAHERRNHVLMEAMERGLKLIEAKKINMKDLITHEFSLEDIDEGFKTLVNKPKGYIKGIVRM